MGEPPQVWLVNRKIDANCLTKMSERRSDGLLGKAKAVNQTFRSPFSSG